MYKTGNDYLDEIGDSQEGLMGVEAELGILSRAFYETGNSYIGDILIEMARIINQSSESINRAVAKEINRECKKSQEQLGETLGLVFEAMNKDLENAIEEIEDKG